MIQYRKDIALPKKTRPQHSTFYVFGHWSKSNSRIVRPRERETPARALSGLPLRCYSDRTPGAELFFTSVILQQEKIFKKFCQGVHIVRLLIFISLWFNEAKRGRTARQQGGISQASA